VNEDWRFAQTIRGKRASALHRKLFGDAPLDGNLYRDYFDRRVQSVDGEGIGFASCHGALACHTGGRSIRLSDSYGALSIPPVIRLSFLIHEARHVDGVNHVECPVGYVSPYQKVQLEGKLECDLDENGVYGPQIVMLKNIALYCESCTSEVREQARRYSVALMNLILSPESRKRLSDDF
jgi:hypothetical protein